MTANVLDSAFGELLHLNLMEEFKSSNTAWTREKLADAYQRALVSTMQDGAPQPAEGSLEAALLNCQRPFSQP